MTAVLWLRRDLRRGDQPALHEAAADGPVVPLFVIDPQLWQQAGPVRQAWLAANVLAADHAYDGHLCVRMGRPEAVVAQVAAQSDARRIHVSRETTPTGVRRDARVRSRLAEQDVALIETGTPYAVGPGLIRTKAGEPYQVFTPFSRAWREHGWPAPAPAPHRLNLGSAESDSDAHGLLQQARKACPILLPVAGEEAAQTRWRQFADTHLDSYATGRDRPDLDVTSHLSADLKTGAIHPRTMLADIGARRGDGVQRFITELAWREFYADVLWHHPRSAWHDLRPALGGLSYDDPNESAVDVEAWKHGRTGFPFVDAGMRQLAETGWMHNRVRMVTASFLTKDLHQWWPIGARHFLAHLIDGDIASNNHGWQWVAGTGTDASPYFRVFNPVTQGKRVDPDGRYVRRWVPELRHLPGAAAHEPWHDPAGYDHGYPQRILDHREERQESLARYEAARRLHL
ncbi:cryptochrome/photolyase family protein [Leekyejoonella antrihumi]|uniref:Deoxyribodipyrimidine photo-lyase n=1 Tax=Leekyejoonella antrihumi TaxID=1660198 RepID=A0A563DZ97_9MICO|nr:deoxyribodipyrimidine photo-lyase [Leekyejoonella antrihumi]TWP35556.1 deoxyribodipyrimidine photo-lyase [Leekyejoonella antrihumi]